MRFFYGLILKIKENYYLLLICILFIVINDAIIISDLYSLKLDYSNKTNENLNIDKNEESNDIFKIDIKGEVKKPGVYEVNENMNVSDAIKLAGGLKKGASTNNINLSKRLSDQMVIVISKRIKSSSNLLNTFQEDNNYIKNDAKINNNEIIGGDQNNTTESINNNQINSCVSINNADIDALLTLNGIGKSKAEAIIEFRNKEKFNTIEDVKNVPGIGDALFEKIKDQICI